MNCLHCSHLPRIGLPEEMLSEGIPQHLPRRSYQHHPSGES
uniref:Uncharacterized protein n=1 Tax=Rhizophora mucronata TaxID=61149 RepID=A0A2P2P8X7_RHIMU